MEHRVEDFLWEIERRRSWSPKLPKGSHRRFLDNRRSHELKILHLDIQYDWEERGREKEGEKRKSSVCVL